MLTNAADASRASTIYKGLSDYLQFVKSKYHDMTDATILLEQDIPYDMLVQMMDNVRVFEKDDPPLFTKVELFPDISVGDAPLSCAARPAPREAEMTPYRIKRHRQRSNIEAATT